MNIACINLPFGPTAYVGKGREGVDISLLEALFICEMRSNQTWRLFGLMSRSHPVKMPKDAFGKVKLGRFRGAMHSFSL